MSMGMVLGSAFMTRCMVYKTWWSTQRPTQRVCKPPRRARKGWNGGLQAVNVLTWARLHRVSGVIELLNVARGGCRKCIPHVTRYSEWARGSDWPDRSQ